MINELNFEFPNKVEASRPISLHIKDDTTKKNTALHLKFSS